MTDVSQQSFEHIVQELTGCGSSRTWSILVTIFGDLAQSPNDEISGPLLSTLTKMIGIKPQAMRVALHRLRRDGWIMTEKSGRTSKYRLSEFGLSQSKIASPHIYGRTVKVPERWHILVATPEMVVDEKNLVIHGYRKLISGVYIGSGATLQDADDFLVIEGKLASLPKWLQTSIADTASIEGYSKLMRILEVVKQVLNAGYVPTITETAVIRTLIVHGWRRIVLRQPDLSLELVSENPSAWCRETVWQLLERLERPTIAALEATAN